MRKDYRYVCVYVRNGGHAALSGTRLRHSLVRNDKNIRCFHLERTTVACLFAAKALQSNRDDVNKQGSSETGSNCACSYRPLLSVTRDVPLPGQDPT